MAVLLNTSVGDLVIDLFTEECPIASKNFLKLCQSKYYNNHLIYNIQQNYLLQTGDPTGTGRGGNSIFGLLQSQENVCFNDEINESRKVNKAGYVGMSHTGGKADTNRSQFFITLRGEDMEHLGHQHTIFGEIAEGLDVLEKLNGLFCDDDGRPYQDVRIRHTYVLDDPFPDPEGWNEAPQSPREDFPKEEKIKRRIPYEEKIDGTFASSGMTEEEMLEEIRKKEARSRAIVLEMTGDLPDADIKPPAEVLFVCKLNPVTRDEDLETIFSQFGRIKSCEIIRDHKTGDSLNYAFIEFETEAACIRAYEKMNNALIDDRRIKVDFSQSVSKIWNKYLLRPKGGPKVKKDGDTKLENIKPSGSSHYGPSSSSSSRQRDMGFNEAKTAEDDHGIKREDSRDRTRSRFGDESRERKYPRRDDSRPRDRHRSDKSHRDDDRRKEYSDRGRDHKHREDSDRGDRHRSHRSRSRSREKDSDRHRDRKHHRDDHSRNRSHKNRRDRSP
jgi:peptidyl-prolyl cis-trans isomerase-like 4